MKYSKEQIEHDWNYCLNYLITFCKYNKNEQNHTLDTMRAIYNRAAKEYGFKYAESLPKLDLTKENWWEDLE